MLEITVGHWPFSDQFQHLADQNPFWSAKFIMHFQWDNLQNVLFSKNGRPISDPYFYHCYGECSDLAFCNAVCML